MVGGNKNEANGENSVAMGYGAKANDDNSVVISLISSGSTSSSGQDQFYVNSKIFSIKIGDKCVDINSSNIDDFESILDGRRRRALKEEEQSSYDDKIIRNLEEQIQKQHETIGLMRAMMESHVHDYNS